MLPIDTGSSVAASKLFECDRDGKPIIPLDSRSIFSFGLLIRKSEQLLLQLFSQGLLSGTTHTCLGQEVCQMSVVRSLSDPGDVVLSNHRNHGHFLTYSGDFAGLVAEVMGRERGVCRGIGGSQHIAFRHFHSNGVQAGMTGIGVGHALAIKKRGGKSIVAAIVGDGTLGEGLLYESLNLASIWRLPLLFVVENNRIAQTTPTSETIGGSIEARGAAFGLQTWRLDDGEPDFLASAESIVGEIRSSQHPGLLVIDTMRLGPHSKGDDLRSEEELAAIRERDPLRRIQALLPLEEQEAIEAATDEFIKSVHDEALHSPESRFEKAPVCIFKPQPSPSQKSSASSPKQTVRASLNQTLRTLLSDRSNVLILGEDLHDPYGGAFKVTAGLSTEFPGRVISTPISEAGVMGTGIGLALEGFRPIVEIMFADFATLAMDQIFNHAVKFPGMFRDTSVPLYIRTPGGGRRGYGPTHSQSIESLLTSVPGLTVVFGSNRHDPGELLLRAVTGWPYPTVCMEHKLLYSRSVDAGHYRELSADPEDAGAELFPTLAGGASDPDLTIVCYGDAVLLAEETAAKLAEEEIGVEILIPSLLAPLPKRTLTAFLSTRRRILALEEAPFEYGFSAELGASLLEAGFRGSFTRVGPPSFPIPAARSLESSVLPDGDAVFDAVVRLFLSEISPSTE